MRAIEFETTARDGMIAIPGQFREFAQPRVRVIVMIEEQPVGAPRVPGSAKGQVWMSDDFDAPLKETEVPEFFS